MCGGCQLWESLVVVCFGLYECKGFGVQFFIYDDFFIGVYGVRQCIRGYGIYQDCIGFGGLDYCLLEFLVVYGLVDNDCVVGV